MQVFFDTPDYLQGTDKLKYYDYDFCATIDLETGNVVKQHKLDKYERIIYLGDNKIMTWKQGKYTVYSADTFKKLSEQDAPEIEADGSYIFCSCYNHVFIFDNNTNEIISKILMN